MELFIFLVDIQGLLITLAIGAVCGWLAGTLMKGGGFGLLWNIIFGIIGGLVGGLIFSTLGISLGSGLIGQIIGGTIGAIVVVFIAGMLKK